MGDYVDDMTPQAKIQTDRPSGSVPTNEWNITLAKFLVFKSFLLLKYLLASRDYTAEAISTLFDL